MTNDKLEVIQEDDSDAWQCQLALEARQREPAPDCVKQESSQKMLHDNDN